MTSTVTTGIKSCRVSAHALLLVIAVCAGSLAHAQNFSVLYDFGSKSGDATQPTGLVAQGRDGSLYSTSFSGGTNGYGTVFKITPAGREKVLYNFCSLTNCVDGAVPGGGLTLRPDGHFLGITQFSSENNQGFGTIFDISPTGSLTTLYTFTGGADGGNPLAPPILGPDGQFYGTTAAMGAPSGCGTIYRIAGGVFSLLHQFNGLDGCYPNSLVLGADGNFYGTTSSGGTADNGVFFQVILRCGRSTLVNVFYNFDYGADQIAAGPDSLIQGSDGSFYGTAYPGVVFKITPTGPPVVLSLLPGLSNYGYGGAIMQAADGDFYGVVLEGGSSKRCSDHPCGDLFQLTAVGGSSILHYFDYTTGSNPETPPFQHTNGLLYGDTTSGGLGGIGSSGTGGDGVLYSWDADLPAFVTTTPFMAKAGSFVEILGQGFTSSTTVSFNGTPAAATVVSGTYLKATVPADATSGFVTVITSSGTLTSNKKFIVMQ